MGRKESNQTNKQNKVQYIYIINLHIEVLTNNIWVWVGRHFNLKIGFFSERPNLVETIQTVTSRAKFTVIKKIYGTIEDKFTNRFGLSELY